MRTLVLPSRLIRRPPLLIDCDITETVVIGNTHTFHATSPNAIGTLTWSVVTPVEGLTINATTGTITWLVGAMLGVSIELQVQDSTGAIGRRSFFTSSRLAAFDSALSIGLLWDLNAPNTLFQDTAGTIPANVGDPVRCIKELGGRYEYRLIRRAGTGSYSGDAIVWVDGAGAKYIQLTADVNGAVFEPATEIVQRATGNKRVFAMGMAYRVTNSESYANVAYAPMMFNGTATTGPMAIGFKGSSGLNSCVWNRVRVVNKTTPSNDVQYLDWNSSNGNTKNFNTSSPLCIHSAIPVLNSRPKIICAWVGTDSGGEATNVHVSDGRPGDINTSPCSWSYGVPYFTGLNDIFRPVPVTNAFAVGNSETYAVGLQMRIYRVAVAVGDRDYVASSGTVYQIISDNLNTDQYANPTIRQPIVAAGGTSGDDLFAPGNSGQPNQKTFDGPVGAILVRGLDWPYLSAVSYALTNITTAVSQYAAVMSLTGNYAKQTDGFGVVGFTVTRNMLVSTWNMGPKNTYQTSANYSIRNVSDTQVIAGTVTWTDSWTPT